MKFIKLFYEFFLFLKARKKLWLSPIIIVIFFIATLLVLTQGTVLAPLIYTLF
jgi:hypothetical protein|tara:strand:- start:164 stop:322 length:159 start_codon:yes stop_codon:yes gene_type:complete